MAKGAAAPKNLTSPGAYPSAFVSDPDAAVEAGRAGTTRKIEKPRAEVPPAKVKVVDSLRPKTMPVNHKTEMSYADAMALHNSGQQTKAILTPEGWVSPPIRLPAGARAG